jgi:hypothetical protein
MDTRRMKVIPEPDPKVRTILAPSYKGPAMKGNGSLDYACGSCGSTLLRSVDYKQVQNVVVKCFSCNSFNEIPASHHAN